MKRCPILIARILLFLLPAAPLQALDVNITEDIESIEVMHDGRPVTIRRNQDPDNTVNPDYARTSRKCPPFCIQPINIAEGVETIGELELLDYLQRMHAGDDSILVIDSRTPDWVRKGTIPGSINISWKTLDPAAGADPFEVADILEEQFNVDTREGLWDFSAAKTLVLFCNGLWCGQSPSNIKSLLTFGYPASKIKWYRGGMQSWELLGFTVVK
ncbi:MAG TPA: rhodanese-like domain-containing protein [Gammaproteobacteria bacterium]|nr:rhodanese-like domain-containing protein [Gammaproteobacteria bacterium]